MISRNSVFGWIALATGLVLLIPAIAMQFSTEVNWTSSDFVIMGVLLFTTGSLFVLAARMIPGRFRLALGIMFTLAFVYVWAELAVGIFTNLGS